MRFLIFSFTLLPPIIADYCYYLLLLSIGSSLVSLSSKFPPCPPFSAVGDVDAATTIEFLFLHHHHHHRHHIIIRFLILFLRLLFFWFFTDCTFTRMFIVVIVIVIVIIIIIIILLLLILTINISFCIIFQKGSFCKIHNTTFTTSITSITTILHPPSSNFNLI